jgi:hypothetical protein
VRRAHQDRDPSAAPALLVQLGQSEECVRKLEGVDLDAIDSRGGEKPLVHRDRRIGKAGSIVGAGQLRVLLEPDHPGIGKPGGTNRAREGCTVGQSHTEFTTSSWRVR